MAQNHVWRYTLRLFHTFAISEQILDRVAAQPPRPLSGAKSQRSILATPLCRSLFFQVRRRAAPRAQGPRDPKGPKGPKGPMGPFGVIPKPFRMESNFEWKVISIGSPFRMEGHFE